MNQENPLEGSVAAPLTRKSILVINCGSSSVKFALIDESTEDPIMSGIVERLREPDARLTWKLGEHKFNKTLPGADLVKGLKEVIAILPPHIEVAAVGHRVVHGAEGFAASFLIVGKILI